MTTDNGIIEKIQKLLAMAEHPNSNEYEAAIALERAQALLLQHNLCRADVLDVDNNEPQGMGKVEVEEKSGYSWKGMLINIIARSTMCRVIRSPYNHKFHIFGTYDNVKSVINMSQWVAPQLEMMAARGLKEYRKEGGRADGRSWKASFYYGACDTISNRLRPAYRKFAEGTGKDLCLYNDKALSEAVKKVFPHTRVSSGGGYARDSSGYSAGKAAGNNVTFGSRGHMNSGNAKVLGPAK